ncbi:MAG: hypothetical protein AB1746_08395 [Candidatus Zixiibacteriota bacterium]
MDIGFVSRTLRTTSLLALVVLIIGTFYFGFYPTLSIVTGIIWGMVNLYFLERLVRSALRPEGVDKMAALVYLFIKFPLLYASLYFMVTSKFFDAILLLIGFTVVLLVIVLKAAGRVLLKLDNNELQNRQESLKSV